MVAQSLKIPRLTPSLQWLRSPWTILASAGLGLYVGTAHPAIAVFTAPIGDLYLSLLKMCVFPILLSAITASIGRLMGSADAKRHVRRIALVFPLGLLLASASAALVAAITGPGKNLSQTVLSTLGIFVNQSGIDLEVSLNGEAARPEVEAGLAHF